MKCNWKPNSDPDIAVTGGRKLGANGFVSLLVSSQPTSTQGVIYGHILYAVWEWLAIYLCWLSFCDLLCETVQAGNPPQDFASWNIQLDLSHFHCQLALSLFPQPLLPHVVFKRNHSFPDSYENTPTHYPNNLWNSANLNNRGRQKLTSASKGPRHCNWRVRQCIITWLISYGPINSSIQFKVIYYIEPFKRYNSVNTYVNTYISPLWDE